MISFHGDEAIKAKYLSRVRAHAAADAIIQGRGWRNGKGCAVGCTLEAYDHALYETELGLPEWLARLEDILFEGCSKTYAKTFPEKFLDSIPVGKNLEPVRWKFGAFILRENIDRVLQLELDESLKIQVVSAIRECLAVYDNAIKTNYWDESAARSARSAGLAAGSAARSAGLAAGSAARSAAELAADSAAESASSSAWSARSAAELAAESAAWSAGSAADSAAWSAAESAAYERYADKLLELLREA